MIRDSPFASTPTPRLPRPPTSPLARRPSVLSVQQNACGMVRAWLAGVSAPWAHFLGGRAPLPAAVTHSLATSPVSCSSVSRPSSTRMWQKPISLMKSSLTSSLMSANLQMRKSVLRGRQAERASVSSARSQSLSSAGRGSLGSRGRVGLGAYPTMSSPQYPWNQRSSTMALAPSKSAAEAASSILVMRIGCG